MKRITFRAEAPLIDASRERARAEATTLNELFRRWLADYTQQRSADSTTAPIGDPPRHRVDAHPRGTR